MPFGRISSANHCIDRISVVMKSLLIVSIYTLAAVAAGNLLIRLLNNLTLRASRPIASQPASVQMALGSALLACVWQLMALGGLLRPGAVWLVMLMCFTLAASNMKRAQALITPRSLLNSVSRIINQGWALSFLTLSLLAVMTWFGVLAYVRPPFGDADAFYFVYSKIIAATGDLSVMPGNYRDFSAIGLSGELHYAALMTISTPEAAKLFAWVAGLNLILLLKDLTKIAGGGVTAEAMTIAMLVTSTTFTDYLSDGKVDIFAACTALAAILCLLNKDNVFPDDVNTAIAGILTGFSITAKFSYIVAFLPAVLLMLLFQTYTHSNSIRFADRLSRILQTSMPFIAGLLIALVPHLLKNYILFDQPLAPFIGMKQNWADQHWFSATDTTWILATYPFALVFGMYPMQGGNLSALWLAALPLSLFLPWFRWSTTSLRNPLVQITLSACIGLLCWLLVKASVLAPRYILATLVMLMPLPAIAVEYVWQHEPRPKLISWGFTIMAGLIILAMPFIPPAGVWTALPNPVIKHLKNGRPECGLAITSYCGGLSSLNDKAKEGERVFVAGYYTYWLRPDQLQCINQPDEWGLLNHANSSEIWSALYGNGFSHIAVQKATHGQYLKMLDPAGAPPWLKVTAESADSDMPVFHLESLDAKRRPAIVCSHTGRNSWAPLAVSGEAR